MALPVEEDVGSEEDPHRRRYFGHLATRPPASPSARRMPGRADVLVGTANEEANEEAVTDVALAPHSLADGDVSVPGADEDLSVPPRPSV